MNHATSIEWWRPRLGTERLPAAGAITLPTVSLGAYFAMHLVPVSDLLVAAGLRVPVVALTGMVVTAMLVTSESVGRFWKAPVAETWMALLPLFVLAATFGQYPGLSVPFMVEMGVRFHVFPFYCCALAVSSQRVRHLLVWMAGATIVLVLLTAMYGRVVDGRLIGFAQTWLENSNDLGFAILFGAPTILVLLKSHRSVGRLVGLSTVPIALFYVLMTGSRGNFVTLVVLAGAAFLFVPRPRKIPAIVCAAGLTVAMVVLIPTQTWRRLTFIVADPSHHTKVDDSHLHAAMVSQADRLELQKHAMDLVSGNLMFGVGPLLFANAVDSVVMQETGRKSSWQDAHNTYLEIAAENGLPALLLYVASLAVCLRMNYRAYRMCCETTALHENLVPTICVLLMTVVFATGATFGNMAYSPYGYVLIGLSAANYLAVGDSVDLSHGSS